MIQVEESDGVENIDETSLLKERQEQQTVHKRTDYQQNELNMKISGMDTQIRDMEMQVMKDTNSMEMQEKQLLLHSRFIDSCHGIAKEIIRAEMDLEAA